MDAIIVLAFCMSIMYSITLLISIRFYNKDLKEIYNFLSKLNKTDMETLESLNILTKSIKLLYDWLPGAHGYYKNQAFSETKRCKEEIE